MSQNTLVLPTSGTLSGLAAVEAINAAVDTLNTLASGASPPSSPEASQFWHDTTNKVLKIRSMDNTTWIAVGTLDETNYQFNATSRPTPPIYGLTLSNDASTPNSIIDIAPGGAADSTAFQYMRLASAITKNVTAAWAAGTGNGSLDTGSLQASKFYHVHLIYDPATAAVDVLTSLSYSNPVLPTGYTNFVAIGAIYSNASSDIQPFVQTGNEFLYNGGFQDAGATDTVTMPALIALTVPTGLKVNALIRGQAVNTNTGTTFAVLFYSPDEGAQTPTLNITSGQQNASLLASGASGGVNGVAAGEFTIRTNTSGQIYVEGNSGGNGFIFGIHTRGFIYPRGLQ